MTESSLGSAPEAPREFRQTRYVPPPGALDLLLVRHGASNPWMPGRDFPLADGHGDPALAPEGVEQAELVARRLAEEPIDAIYVTSLQRTHQTAAPLARLTGLVPLVEPDLREVMLGDWEGGMFRQKVASGDPIAVRMLTEERWGVIPGAEQDDDLNARVVGAVDRLAARHLGQRVVAVTHGGVISALLRHATGSRPFAFLNSDNCSVSELVVLGDHWQVRRFNDTFHLGLAAAPAPT